MTERDDIPEGLNTVLTDLEAEIYVGAKWRTPTNQEIDELAQFFAEDFISGDIMIGEEMDSIEQLIRINEEKVKLIEELKTLTMVLDLEKIEIQIFHTYSFSIEIGKITNNLTFADGPCRVIKQNGIMRNYSDELVRIC